MTEVLIGSNTIQKSTILQNTPPEEFAKQLRWRK